MKISKDETRQAHPGWAVRFENGTWLCIAHGGSMAVDAFYANTYETKELANLTVLSCYSDGDIANTIGYEVVVAWEHCCEVMRHHVKTLREANKINPTDIMEMTGHLKEVIATLNKK